MAFSTLGFHLCLIVSLRIGVSLIDVRDVMLVHQQTQCHRVAMVEKASRVNRNNDSVVCVAKRSHSQRTGYTPVESRNYGRLCF